MTKPTDSIEKSFDDIVQDEPTAQEKQIQELQKDLLHEKDARLEERFVFIILLVLLLNVVFFSVTPSFGGPIALLVLELLILIPLANRMGIQEVAQIINRVLDRVAVKGKKASNPCKQAP